MRSISAVLFGCVLLAPMGAFAKDDHGDHEEVGNQNRVICRTEQEIGSRLSKVRRCHTAAEWAQIKRENRAIIDRVQAYKPNNGS